MCAAGDHVGWKGAVVAESGNRRGLGPRASAPPTDAELAAIVAFETGLSSTRKSVRFQAGLSGCVGGHGRTGAGAAGILPRNQRFAVGGIQSDNFHRLRCVGGRCRPANSSADRRRSRGAKCCSTPSIHDQRRKRAQLVCERSAARPRSSAPAVPAMIRPMSDTIRRSSLSILEYPTRVLRQSTFPDCRAL